MKIGDRLSLKEKLVVILMLMAMTALFSAFTFTILHDVRAFRKEMREHTLALARVIGDYSVVDLAFEDKASSTRTLAKLSTLPDILCARIFDQSGSLFASYATSGCHDDMRPRSGLAIEFKERCLDVYHPITYNGIPYGIIYICASTQPLRDQLIRYFTTMLAVAAALLLLSFVLAVRLQRIISRPILTLAGTARRIAEVRDYNIRIEERRNDEIGVLYQSFDEMLVQLQKRKEERDRAELALRESEERYRLLVESSPFGIFVEQDGRIVYANPAGMKLSGRRSMKDLEIPLDHLIQHDVLLHEEGKLIREDDRAIDVEFVFVSTIYNGRTATQALVRDISESKALREAAQRMEQMAALGEFSAMVAHEVRNSLGSIGLNLRILSERMDIPVEYKKNLHNIEAGTHKIQEIIRGVLEYSRPAPSRLRQTDLHRIIDNSVHQVEDDLHEAGIQLERRYQANSGNIWIDPEQIGQVMVNLLLNAKHAIVAGGTITIRTEDADRSLIVSVSDNGVGIPAENLSKIFRPFFTTRSQGTGLGLAYVARILEQHKAHITVDSHPGTGTTFTIRFSAGGEE